MKGKFFLNNLSNYHTITCIVLVLNLTTRLWTAVPLTSTTSDTQKYKQQKRLGHVVVTESKHFDIFFE